MLRITASCWKCICFCCTASYLWTRQGKIQARLHRRAELNPGQQEEIPSLTEPLWSLHSFQDKERSKQTNTNHIQGRDVNKHLSPRVKLKPVRPGSTVTSDRHGEGEIQNTPTGSGKKETRLTSKFQNRSTQSPQRPPPTSTRKWLFTTEQLYFRLSLSVVLEDPDAIKVESPWPGRTCFCLSWEAYSSEQSAGFLCTLMLDRAYDLCFTCSLPELVQAP